MADIMGTLRSLTDAARQLITAEVQLEKAELKLRLVDLMGKLVEVRTELLSLLEENVELKRAVTELRGGGEFDNCKGVLWKRDGKKHESTPYCPKCRLPMRYMRKPPDSFWRCSNCSFEVGHEVSSPSASSMFS